MTKSKVTPKRCPCGRLYERPHQPTDMCYTAWETREVKDPGTPQETPSSEVKQ
jgi:hypothetical protein